MPYTNSQKAHLLAGCDSNMLPRITTSHLVGLIDVASVSLADDYASRTASTMTWYLSFPTTEFKKQVNNGLVINKNNNSG